MKHTVTHRLLFSIFVIVGSMSFPSKVGAIQLDSRLGTVIAAPNYPDRHIQRDILSYGAQKAFDIGFRSLEIWLHPNVCNAHIEHPDTTPYGFYQNTGWCNTNGLFNKNELMWLVQQNEFQKVLSMPLKTYFLTTDALNPDALTQEKVSKLNRLATSQEKDLLFREYYDLTTYLLTRYAETNKTFIIMTGNELEWRVTAKSGCQPDCDYTVPDPMSVQNAILWVNTAHDAIEKAKADHPTTKLRLYHASEINYVLSKKISESALTQVVPYLNVDLMGWSAHELNAYMGKGEDVSKIAQAGLDKIAQHTRDSDVFGTHNVYISEYGLSEMGFTQYPNSQIVQNKLMDFSKFISSATGWGVPYFTYWSLYDNNCSTFLPTEDQCINKWIVRPDKTLGIAYMNVLSTLVPGVLPSSPPISTDLAGDINTDGYVNILDSTLLSNAFGSNDTAADINTDGTVNILDYTILSTNFGKSQ